MEDYIDLPPVEKLDNVLTLIATDIRLKNSYFKFDLICEILFEMKPRYIFNNPELTQILKKLQKDGYIEYFETKDKNLSSPLTLKQEQQQHNFVLSFEGRYFQSNGGYTQKTIFEKNENERVLALEVSSEKQADVLNRLTKWIAFATVPMGVYAFYQILQSFFCLLGLLCNCK